MHILLLEVAETVGSEMYMPSHSCADVVIHAGIGRMD